MNTNSKILIIILSLFISSCKEYKVELQTGKKGVNLARTNIILDFANHRYKTPKYYLKKRNGKPFDVFHVYTHVGNKKSYIFTISPENDGYITLGINDTLGKVPASYFPNKFIVINGKLFLWKDNKTPLSKEILQVLNKYKVLDSTDIKEHYGMLPPGFKDTRLIILDDGLKGADYFVCKNNIRKFRRIYTNRAFGYYKNPKIKCRK